MGSTVGFGEELWLGGVSGVENVNINKSRKGKVGGAVLVRRTEIVFDMGWSG